jgi:Restriction endonuclease
MQPTAGHSDAQICSNRAAALRPQPIDYGLTYDDLNLYNWPTIWSCRLDDGKVIQCLGTRSDDNYKDGRRWFSVLHYWQALHRYDKEKAAAEAAARAAARDAELRKRSYWEFLDGYEFERATAEVLQRHQFNPRVTPGSADGGIDIEVTRGGLRGVVQCKAHVACVGPHVIRDLYGVIHHSRASFGIIVSRGGFTKGAVEFARDKPILFLDVSDLIAMQEGRDVLAGAFTRTET